MAKSFSPATLPAPRLVAIDKVNRGTLITWGQVSGTRPASGRRGNSARRSRFSAISDCGRSGRRKPDRYRQAETSNLVAEVDQAEVPTLRAIRDRYVKRRSRR